jgi:hypothetical protein
LRLQIEDSKGKLIEEGRESTKSRGERLFKRSILTENRA